MHLNSISSQRYCIELTPFGDMMSDPYSIANVPLSVSTKQFSSNVLFSISFFFFRKLQATFLLPLMFMYASEIFL